MKANIEQRELEAFANLRMFLNMAALDFRERLLNGASVEPGSISIEAEKVADEAKLRADVSSLTGLLEWGISVDWTGQRSCEFGYIPRALDALDTVLNINRNYRGTSSPLEELISDLLRDYG